MTSRKLFSSHVRSALVALGVIGPIGLLNVWAAETGDAGAKVALAPEKFKNIQVLKTLPADQLMPVMMKINASLGVNCGYCHVQGDFAKDDKPAKQVTRGMITMTGDINTRYKVVAKQVTCYTCHHGKAMPDAQAKAG